MKQLFGITGTKNTTVKNARTIICNSANLLHTNIKQPVWNELAKQTGFSAFELEHHIDLYKTLMGREYSAIELYCQIEQCILEENSNALIETAEEDMLGKKITSSLANGYLVSGIDNNTEAQWLRDLDGLLIHIIDKNAPSIAPEIVIEENDIVISFDTYMPVTHECLQPLINRLISLTKPTKEAA